MCSSASRQLWRIQLPSFSARNLGNSTGQVWCRYKTVHASRKRWHSQVRNICYTAARPIVGPISRPDAPVSKAVQDRKRELDTSEIVQYPRLESSILPTYTLRDFATRYEYLKRDEIEESDGPVVVAGRIASVRKSGGKLAFVDITEEPDHQKLQILLNLGHLQLVEKKEFVEHIRLIRRGDIISARGFPCRSSSGELSLRASELTTMLSPCLHTIPLSTVHTDLSSNNDLLDKHVKMLADPSVIQTLMTRTKLISTLRRFFQQRDFCEVQTPMLAAVSGGATARSFETTATEFQDRKLALRIAPELWLKRLILGGMPRIFEIGQSFRNEGLDSTHNPEFTTCEFYAVYHTLSQLQRLTEQLLRDISAAVCKESPGRPSHAFFEGDSKGQFAVIDFIPAINARLTQPLPNLASSSAREEVLQHFRSLSIPVPSVPTLPRLLDKLCAHLLEPQCVAPTWIINTPECLSPLAKSFIHPSAANSQPVAARAELFINQKELVNCYEEENSPSEQRRKFIDQQRYARIPSSDEAPRESIQSELKDAEAMEIDLDYLQALEWGLPPTGGWGCGIDRLVMLFTGKTKISDVLTFGSLRAVTRGTEHHHKYEDIGVV